MPCRSVSANRPQPCLVHIHMLALASLDGKRRRRNHVCRHRGLAQRACAAFRSALLRSSGPTFRQRAAPRPTAVL